MFDRLPDAATESETVPRAREHAHHLYAAYDGLFDVPPTTLSDQQASELVAMAGIYDLDTDRSHAEVWDDLRTVLTRTTPREVETFDPAPSAEPMTILLVEDDTETAADLTEALIEAGHNVVGPFHRAEAAEAAVGLHAIDVALLDINLSGDMDGVTLARSLKDRWGLTIVFLSGDVAAAARHAELAATVVLKPYSVRDVLASLTFLQARAGGVPG